MTIEDRYRQVRGDLEWAKWGDGTWLLARVQDGMTRYRLAKRAEADVE